MSLKSLLSAGFLAIFGAVGTAHADARLQVIHNSADPAAATVDVYLNGLRILDDFAFRTATPFINAPAGIPFSVGIAPGNSTSAADTLKNFVFTLAAGETYVAIANGVLNPANFESNPDGRATGFGLFVKAGAKEAGSGGNVEFFALHGATDAPTVDVVARGVATLVDNAAYGDITGYIAVPPASYTLDVTDASGTVTVASYTADLSGLADGSAVVFASGFLSPANDQNGEAFGLYAALVDGTVIALPVKTPSARLQVIHNAADPAAASVDIYLDGGLLLDNFAFRAATPFIDAPAGTPINIGVAGGNSTSAADTLKNFQLTLTDGETYVAIANGVLNPANFESNPDGRATGFGLFIKAGAREAGSGGNVEFFALHGATDAPTVDVVARGVATLVDNAAYGDITGYIAVPPASYTLDVKDSSGTVTVASYVADLSGLADGSAVVFASGFLSPANDQNGEAFGLYAALVDGSVIALPVKTPSARLQVIHNAADPAAASVDIYLDGGLLLDNFAFRAATPFIDAPAGTPINIGVAGGNGTSAADTLKNFQLTLTDGETYVAIANGVLNPANFESNPDGRSTGFGLFVKAGAKEAGSGGNVEFFALHGATDAPTVDVVARGVATLVDNAAYGDITGYIPVPPASYTLDVKDSSGTVTVASYTADLSGLANGSAVVFASGFLSPANDQNGEAFGLYAALVDGTVIALPVKTPSARLQVIHNAADPAAASVDIYLDGGLLLDNFAFRAATPFIDAPAGTPINIGVAGGNSTSAADTLKNFQLTLTDGETYVAIANGVLNPANFESNPDGRATGFGLFIKAGAREAGSGGNVEFFALHGATDAPTVDVVARGVATLVDNAAYGDITGYIAVPPASYTLDVTDASGAVTVASYTADLSGLADGSAVVFASGFLSPANDQNGEAFGLYAALVDGTVITLPSAVTSVDLVGSTIPDKFELTQNYPNPFNPSTQISFSIAEAQFASLKVFNSIGQEVATLVNGEVKPGVYNVTFNAAGLPSGTYFYRLVTNSFVGTKKMMLVK